MSPAHEAQWHIDKSAYLGLVRDIVVSEFARCGKPRLLHTWGPTVVAAVPVADGETVVVKASRRQDIHAEARACRLAHQAGVPVPRVIALGLNETMPGGRWYMMTQLPGLPWNSLPTDESVDVAVLDQLATCFAELHSVAGTGFGPVTSSAGEETGSWPQWLQRGFTTDLGHLGTGGVATGRLHELCDASLSRLTSELDERPCVLTHADLGDGEVFVDPRTARVTGLADWGSAIFGDPLYDFARFVAGGPADDNRPTRFLPQLRAAYSRQTSLDWTQHSSLIDLYDAHNAISNAAWAMSEGVDWVSSLCNRAEDLFTRILNR